MTAPSRTAVRASVGFFGKLPSRGDFVRAGLPGSFVAPWDEWISRVLAASREALLDRFRPAWHEAPIWYFALESGVCGPDAAIGLWMPSVDAGGREFPLMIAAVSAESDAAWLALDRAAFLAGAEQAGLDAIADDLPPDVLAQRVVAAGDANEAGDGAAPPFEGRSGWWTAGSPFVPATAFTCDELPGAVAFARMIDAGGPSEGPAE